MKVINKLLAAALLTVSAWAQPAHASSARADPAQCVRVIAELRHQGASIAVSNRLGRIAWRESGCVAQRVADSDDLSWSRFGLNFRGSMPRMWARLCGVADYRATRILSIDARCALAAYHRLGWAPWR